MNINYKNTITADEVNAIRKSYGSGRQKLYRDSNMVLYGGGNRAGAEICKVK
jgi:hypothetical protein